MATPTTSGTEFQVNSYITSNQSFPSMTGLEGGGFVVTWTSLAQDGSSSGVYGQRYNGDGTPAGVEFLINFTTLGDQSSPSVTALEGGGFVVTWNAYNQDAPGSFDDGIFGQRYNGDGSLSGGEFQINTFTASDQYSSSVASMLNGGFVVTWISSGQDGSSSGIFAQRFNGGGSPVGTEFQVNSQTDDVQTAPSVASLTGGGFVVTWRSDNQDAPGDNNAGIFGQRYNADGTPAGTEFQVNSFTDNDQLNSSVTGLADGGFVVTWQSDNQDAPGLNFGIFGQRYNADGTIAGTEFQINTYTTSDQDRVSVTALANGGFVATWGSDGQDGDSTGIYGQRYNVDGTKNGTEFQINTETALYQARPTVTALSDGGFVVAWTSRNQDGGADGIFAQRFSVDVFTSGDDVVYLTETGGPWNALAGDDYVIGSDAADSVDGGDGSDWLYGQGGDDTINAGAGAMDVSLGDDGNDTINGEGGMDYMYGYAGNDTLRGGDGDDVAYGGTGNDELYGDDGADWLFGEAGNDKLFGGAGADLLMGGAGVDEITGGAGNDWLWGGDMTGAGDGVADTFFFGANWGGDVIWDFEDGSDMLDVSGAGITSFADLTIGTFGQFTTITSASGDIIYLRGAGDVAIAESSIDAADFIFA